MTRRGFLQLVSIALISPALLARVNARRSQGLDKFTIPGSACKDEKPTPAVTDEEAFRAGAPQRANLVEPGAAGQKLVVSGVVKGLVCGAIAGARVDFWQADARGVVDPTGFRLRGYQMTDANGRYRLETIVPGAVQGRARRINARVTAPGKPSLTTSLFFSDDSLAPKDPAYHQELAIKPTPDAGALTATFDFILDA